MNEQCGGDQARPISNGTQDCARSIRDDKWYWIGKSILHTHARTVGVFGVAVYNCLASHANSDQTCYPSQQRIAGMLGCSRAAVNKAIKALEECGLIAVERRGRYPQLYRLLKPRCNSDRLLLSMSRDFDVAPVRTNNNHGTRTNNDKASRPELIHNADHDGNFKPAIQGEPLALELAEALNDRRNLPVYLSYCRRYPESLLRGVIRQVLKIPPSKIRKSRAALFSHLIKAYGKHDQIDNSCH